MLQCDLTRNLLLDRWNRVSTTSSLCRLLIDQLLRTDASGSWGCGAFCGSKRFSPSWESCPAIQGPHISVKELLPIIFSCTIWAESMRQKHIRQMQQQLQRSTRGQGLRCLLCQAQYHLVGSPPGRVEENTSRCSLSRDDISTFTNEMKDASPMPSTISKELLEGCMRSKLALG